MRGRPRKENGREYRLSVRLNDEELDMLEYLCEEFDDSPSEVIRRIIRYVYIKRKHGVF